MKRIYLFAAIIVLAIIGLGLSVNAHNKSDFPQEETAKVTSQFDGMYFTVEGVVETFGYNWTAWYMVYNDPDAGMDYEVIRIDQRTHDLIVEARNSHRILTGTMKATQPYESIEHVLEADEWRVLYQYPQMTIE